MLPPSQYCSNFYLERFGSYIYFYPVQSATSALGRSSKHSGSEMLESLKPIRLFDLRWVYRRLLTFVFRGMLTVSGYNCFLDICLALLPCTFVWHPNLRLGRKLQLSILLGLGIL